MKSLNPPSVSRFLIFLFAVGFSLACATGAFCQEGSGGIREAMTPQQFKAAGLEKLTPDELAKLDAFLRGDREKAIEKATAKTAKREKLQLVVSRVDGVITSITPRQVIRLEDGSTWMVAKTDFQFRGYVDHPAAAAYKTLFGWKMRIVNVAEIYVVPQKR
ncbi:MAG: hypothetical protein H0X40_17570 [Chthoniobacterales bacterium]|nr:hypothetical protein [Chthoniobacterales bacterium]